MADVRQFHGDLALEVVLRLNLTLTYHRPLDQEALLLMWLPDHAERFLAVLREQSATVVFREVQILNVIRLAILHGPRRRFSLDRLD